MQEARAVGAVDVSKQEPTRVFLHPEHLILGLLLEARGIAAQVLESIGVDLASARGVAASSRRSDFRERGAASGFRITIDDQSESSSIHQQIIDRIREAVATGDLRPGQRLQPVRALADELDIAPGTVARAYAELERLGVVVTEGARGTRVAEARRIEQAADDRFETLTGLLRPVAVAAFHLGGTATELRAALEAAMKGILDGGAGAT
jgi:GntR family transcriptional regulator